MGLGHVSRPGIGGRGSRWFIFLATFVTRCFMAIGPPIWITDDFEALVFGMSIHATFFTFELRLVISGCWFRTWTEISRRKRFVLRFGIVNGSFPRGCNASFIALIPKVVDAKLVTDFLPISLIGCVYKVVTKILANRLATVISDLVSNTQSAFVANRHILDGPFILNEVLSWCKRKRKQGLVFKVNFAKAYDSVRWDFLLDILHAFGFGSRWCTWIRGIFTSNMASILVNGSPTAEFPMCCGLKQSDPLAPLLFILVMKTLHISVSRVANDGIFRGLHIQGLRINMSKSQVLGIEVPSKIVLQGASRIGCDILHTPFKYLGVMVGDHMSRLSAWSNSIQKIRAKLSKWKGNKITWVAWDKVLSSNNNGGLGGFDFLSYCKVRIGDGLNTRFWLDMWILDMPLCARFPRIFALENDTDVSVAMKQGAPSLDASFRRSVRDGVERFQWEGLVAMVGDISLSSSADGWVCDLNGDGEFRVKDIRTTLDNLFLPSSVVATRWVKHVPIKVNIFAWRARLDCLPTRGNLISRGVVLNSSNCPNCNLVTVDSQHLFLSCDLAKSIAQKLCRWWCIQWADILNFDDWNIWFSSIRLPVKLKVLLEGVFFTSWWHIWSFRNPLLFDAFPPRRSVLFDDIVSSSFIWSVNRCNSSFSWESWLKNPNLILL
nr:hypothetical protein [Tanacetum cinerariifolium]